MPSMRPSSSAANRSVMKKPGVGSGAGDCRSGSIADAAPDLIWCKTWQDAPFWCDQARDLSPRFLWINHLAAWRTWH